MPTDIDREADSSASALAAENARLRQELQRLRAAERLLDALLANAPLLISTKDLRGTVTLANRHFNVLDGYDAANFVGHNVFDLFPPAVAEQLWRNDQRAARERCPIRAEETVRHADQTMHIYSTVKFPLFDDDGCISTDITAAREAQIDSVTDELTGLKNRRYFNMRFMEERKRAQRDRRVLTLLLADVDRFKGYNDSYGHPQGDLVLVAVAQAMHAAMNRPGDLCFRLGGDEFACLFASSGVDESCALAEKIRCAMLRAHIAHRANPPFGQVTLSIGLAFIDVDATLDQAGFYELGDQALYRAKAKGRNTVSR